MTTQADAGNAPRKKPLSFGWVVLLSLHLLVLAFAIPETFRWTDRWTGFYIGLVTGGIFALMVAVLLLPVLLLVVKLLSRWWKPGQFSRALMIALPLVLLGVQVVDTATTSAPERFEGATDVALPANANNLRTYFSGGGLADRADEYYFETTPEEVDRLIRELALEERGEPYPRDWFRLSLPEPLADWPGAVTYKGYRSSMDFFVLITDGSRTRVFLQVLGM